MISFFKSLLRVDSKSSAAAGKGSRFNPRPPQIRSFQVLDAVHMPQVQNLCGTVARYEMEAMPYRVCTLARCTGGALLALPAHPNAPRTSTEPLAHHFDAGNGRWAHLVVQSNLPSRMATMRLYPTCVAVNSFFGAAKARFLNPVTGFLIRVLNRLLRF